MTLPYGLIADLHAHAWSAFSSLDTQGRNTRLMAIVNEIKRCADETKKAGGNHMIIAGDLFHVRGSVSPEVFNPVQNALLGAIGSQGIDGTVGLSIAGIPGNHDLASKNSEFLGSSVAMLSRKHLLFHHKTAINYTSRVVMIPWFNNVSELLAELKRVEVELKSRSVEYDVVIHRGIDGTLSNMPAKGLTAEKLAEFKFHRIFAGDYHHHKDFGNNVYSIGAAAHHTWSDVGTKAGFLIVHPDKVVWHCTHAPRFVDITEVNEADEIPLLVDGHFVRARIDSASALEVNELRDELIGYGAKGVLIQTTPVSSVEKRENVSSKSLETLDKSVSDYVKETGMNSAVQDICADIMKETTA